MPATELAGFSPGVGGPRGIRRADRRLARLAADDRAVDPHLGEQVTARPVRRVDGQCVEGRLGGMLPLHRVPQYCLHDGCVPADVK